MLSSTSPPRLRFLPCHHHPYAFFHITTTTPTLSSTSPPSLRFLPHHHHHPYAFFHVTTTPTLSSTSPPPLRFLPCHHHSYKPNTCRHTCIGAIAEDAGRRCDRIVRTVFLSACRACFESSVCVTSEWDLTCPRGDAEAAARL